VKGARFLEVRARESSDKGIPFVAANAQSSASKSFMEIVKKVEYFLRTGQNQKIRKVKVEDA
jgi:MinD-like ATPase involved in chromosome partitioning or flagellar assembly